MPPKLAQLPIASTYCARPHSAATMSRLGRPSKTSKRPVPFGPWMMLPSTQNSVSGCSPAITRSMIAAASRGDSSESDGCHSRWAPWSSRKAGSVWPGLPRPSAPRMAIDSPLQAPHSIHRIVGVSSHTAA